MGNGSTKTLAHSLCSGPSCQMRLCTDDSLTDMHCNVLTVQIIQVFSELKSPAPWQ